jgi:hypothetical protein
MRRTIVDEKDRLLTPAEIEAEIEEWLNPPSFATFASVAPEDGGNTFANPSKYGWKILGSPTALAKLNALALPRRKRGRPPRAPILKEFFEERYPDSTITIKKATLRAEILNWRPDLTPLADKTLAKAINEHNARRVRKI